MTSTGRGRRRLWLVNQYAVEANAPGINRHAMLAAAFEVHGWDTTVFNSDSHYWNLGRRGRPTGHGGVGPGNPVFVHVRTPDVVTNGARRVVSMTVFALRVVVAGLARLRVEKPDVVLGSSPHLFGAVGGYVVARLARRPFVLEVRDLWPASLVHLMGLSHRHPAVWMMRGAERFLYRHADAIVTVLPGMQAHIDAEATQHGPVVHVPNGVVCADLPAATSPLDRPGFHVVYAGAHGIPNSLHTILDAAALLQHREKAEGLEAEARTRFTFVGDGKEKAALQRHANELGLTNATFFDPVPKDEVPGILATGDALALPWLDTPLYRFGVSPNKLFDYFAAAKPVIMALDAPYNPVQDSGAGVTVEPESPEAFADAIQLLRSMSREDRFAMGLRGREYVEREHDMADLGARYVRLLDSLVEGAPTRPTS